VSGVTKKSRRKFPQVFERDFELVRQRRRDR
jgi:hypothetical protein